MKIYDSKMKEISELDFGRVNVGESKTVQFILYNENNSVATVSLKVEKVSLSLTSASLGFKQKVLVEATWTPLLSLKESLRVELKIDGGEVF